MQMLHEIDTVQALLTSQAGNITHNMINSVDISNNNNNNDQGNINGSNAVNSATYTSVNVE